MAIRNLSEHENGEWLAGGLTEELRRQIDAWDSVEVIPGALTTGLTGYAPDPRDRRSHQAIGFCEMGRTETITAIYRCQHRFPI